MIYTLQFKSNSAYNFTADAGGNSFRFHIKHDLRHDSYYMDIEKRTGAQYAYIARCIALTTGCDLFIPFQRHGLGSLFIVPLRPEYYALEPSAETIVDNYVMVWGHN